MAISHADVPVGKDLVPGSGALTLSVRRAGQRRTGDNRLLSKQNF